MKMLACILLNLFSVQKLSIDCFACHISESRTLTPLHFVFTPFTFFEDFIAPFDIENRHESKIEHENEKHLGNQICEETFKQ